MRLHLYTVVIRFRTELVITQYYKCLSPDHTEFAAWHFDSYPWLFERWRTRISSCRSSPRRSSPSSSRPRCAAASISVAPPCRGSLIGGDFASETIKDNATPHLDYRLPAKDPVVDDSDHTAIPLRHTGGFLCCSLQSPHPENTSKPLSYTSPTLYNA